MPHYKLKYFHTRGRAQPIRLLFVDAGIEFEDVRFTHEEWQEKKAVATDEFPLQQLPTLEIDGRVMVQSRAMYHHLARKYGYNGRSEEEAVMIDVVCEIVEDVNMPKGQLIFTPLDEAYKAKLKEETEKTTMPVNFKFLEKMLEENPDGNGYFVGKDVTMADLVFLSFIESVVNVFPNALDDFPKLRANMEVVKSRNKIAAFLANEKPSYM